MITTRPSNQRGHLDHGWLDTYHTFSFGEYHDPAHMGYRSLRVINDDRVAPGMGFGTHPHRDMEIITYVLDGELEHKDSMGNGSVIRPGDVQYMSAGTGVRHSEFNPSQSDPVHLLQIWIMPDRAGHTPRYAQQHFSRKQRLNQLRTVISPDGRDGSIAVQQDAVMQAAIVEPGKRLTQQLDPARHQWLHVASGTVQLDGQVLQAGDAVAITGEKSLQLTGKDQAEVLLFDLA
jgi:redox-sensitive bicupin YhaK (pirin superfamily)